jgi:Holliday junction resolvasome RuvABC endonuclease subunit
MEHPNTSIYRIVGIDPGTNTLGVASLGFDLEQKTLALEEATTFTANHLTHRFPGMVDVHGERFARIHTHRCRLLEYFQTRQPHAIASESPFFGRLAQPYAALTECVYGIRLAVQDYDCLKPLNTYDPATVKKNIGVSGKSGDKDAMRRAVLALPFIQPHQHPYLATIDEHAIDAIAVGYSHFLMLAQL